MSFDLEGVRAAVAAHGTVARIVIAGHKGSAPRDTGTAMLVWDGGQSGTIGGGALEFAAVAEAFATRTTTVRRVPLGPALGQCCGGAVTLVTEWFSADSLPVPDGGLVLRQLVKNAPQTLDVQRHKARMRNGTGAELALVDNWLIERIAQPIRPVWIYGAGHVGRAIAALLAPLPEWDVVLIDTAPDRLPNPMPARVTPLIAAQPARLVAQAPAQAHHLVLTYSHAMDLEICHHLLTHGFGWAGLIGSATKWARFRSRLAALGHETNAIARLTCPIGTPAYGKHPQAIAIGVAAQLMAQQAPARSSHRSVAL